MQAGDSKREARVQVCAQVGYGQEKLTIAEDKAKHVDKKYPKLQHKNDRTHYILVCRWSEGRNISGTGLHRMPKTIEERVQRSSDLYVITLEHKMPSKGKNELDFTRSILVHL